jgi:hypothetical protein
MRYDEQQLCAGVVELTEPTLLITGDASALAELANHIQENREFRLPKSNCINIAVSFVPSDSPSKLQRNGNEYILSISASDAKIFADQLRGLVNSHVPAHTYLDLPDEIPMIISKDEYDPKRVFLGHDEEK